MQTVGLSMIVKNAAETLHSCLDSVRGLVSQIVVGDTGSSDETPSIARACGAKVISVPWEDHFANARNAVLEHMTTDWVLALDADEEIDSNAIQLLPSLLEAAGTRVYSVTHRIYVKPGTPYYMGAVSHANDNRSERAKKAGSYYDLKTIRLIRRDSRVYYSGRIHELLEYRVGQLGYLSPDSGLVIHNFGYLDDEIPELMERKKMYYRKLSRLKVKEQWDNPFAWFDLGKLECESFHNLEFALSCFRRASRLYPSFVRAWLFAAELNLQLGQIDEALAALAHTDSTQDAASWRERLRGDAHAKLGQMALARKSYTEALRLSGTDPVVESRLGYTEVLLGLAQPGIQRMHSAVDLEPTRPELHDLLMKAYIISGDLAGAAAAAEQFAAHVGHPKTFLRAAAIRAQLEQFEAAESLVSRGLDLYPDSIELRESRAYLVRKAQSIAHTTRT